MQKIKISTAKKLVDQFISSNRKSETKTHSPIYLHSSPGLGKSSIISQISDELKIGFVDVRLAQMESSDVAGIPYVSHAGKETEEMKVSVPHWFPSEEKIKAGLVPKEGIIFFDELSNAVIGVQHAAYGIILDRQVHGVKMGDGWQIIAAGNLKDDKTGAKGVAPALANRFACHVQIVPDLGDFVSYALAYGIHREVIGFLNFKQDALYRFDPKKSDMAYATPRSWESASNILHNQFDHNTTTIALSGCIGEGTANEFMAFRKYYEQLPNFTDIMDGKVEYTVPKDDMGLVFAVSSSIITALVENSEHTDRVKNLSNVMNQLDDDFITLIYKSLQSAGKAINAHNIIINSMDVFKRVTQHLNAKD